MMITVMYMIMVVGDDDSEIMEMMVLEFKVAADNGKNKRGKCCL